MEGASPMPLVRFGIGWTSTTYEFRPYTRRKRLRRRSVLHGDDAGHFFDGRVSQGEHDRGVALEIDHAAGQGRGVDLLGR